MWLISAATMTSLLWSVIFTAITTDPCNPARTVNAFISYLTWLLLSLILHNRLNRPCNARLPFSSTHFAIPNMSLLFSMNATKLPTSLQWQWTCKSFSSLLTSVISTSTMKISIDPIPWQWLLLSYHSVISMLHKFSIRLWAEHVVQLRTYKSSLYKWR